MAQLGSVRQRICGELPNVRCKCRKSATCWVLIARTKGSECWEARCILHKAVRL